jgi:hypothetical protein
LTDHFSDRLFKTNTSFVWVCLFRSTIERGSRLLPSTDAALAQNLLDAPVIVNKLFMNFVTPPLSATCCTFQVHGGGKFSKLLQNVTRWRNE